MEKKTTETSSEMVYEGFNKVFKKTYNQEGKTINREVMSGYNGVAGIVYDTEKEKYIFVKQFRAGAESDMIEVVAGMLDNEHETPEEALKREIIEEIGYKVDHMKHLKDFYVSPGKLSEVCSLFYVEVSEKVSEGGGEGDENIEIIEVDYLGSNGDLFWNPDVENKIYQPPYQIIDAKTIIAVNIMETNRVMKDMADVLTQAKLRSL